MPKVGTLLGKDGVSKPVYPLVLVLSGIEVMRNLTRVLVMSQAIGRFA